MTTYLLIAIMGVMWASGYICGYFHALRKFDKLKRADMEAMKQVYGKGKS